MIFIVLKNENKFETFMKILFSSTIRAYINCSINASDEINHQIVQYNDLNEERLT